MMIPVQQIIFSAFALTAIVSGTIAVSANNPVRAVLALVLTFFAASGMWLMAQSEFLALVLVLVYVGAVMTLFLFVVMMLNIEEATVKAKFRRVLPFLLSVGGLILLLLLVAIRPEQYQGAFLNHAVSLGADYSSTKALGAVLYTVYAYPFILAGCLLLVAIIAAISLAHRPPRNCRTQDVVSQMRVRREDRVELIKMDAEPREQR